MNISESIHDMINLIAANKPSQAADAFKKIVEAKAAVIIQNKTVNFNPTIKESVNPPGWGDPPKGPPSVTPSFKPRPIKDTFNSDLSKADPSIKTAAHDVMNQPKHFAHMKTGMKTGMIIRQHPDGSFSDLSNKKISKPDNFEQNYNKI